MMTHDAGGPAGALDPPALLGELAAAVLQSDAAGQDTINLVPSENRMSPLARLPLCTDFYHRYFFNEDGDPGFWQFRGGQAVSRFETEIAACSLSRLGMATFVNVRPISGMSAMMLVLAAYGDPGAAVVSVSQETGGHYATAGLARRLGLGSRTVPVERGVLDPDALRSAVADTDAALVYIDLQNSLDPLDVAGAVAVVREANPRTRVHVDASHTLGLVLGGLFPNPLDLGADSFGGSTHKSFPGPHKGVVLTRSAALRDQFRAAQFTLLSSHHFAETLSLGLAAAEFEHFGARYAPQVVRNARALAIALRDRGFDVHGDAVEPTRTHQVWIRIGDADDTDRLAECLFHGGVRVNVQVDLPGLPGPAFRLGASEITFEGANEEAMGMLAECFGYARDGLTASVAKLRREIRSGLTSPYFFTDAVPATLATGS